jgi:hypothetical protein
MKIQVEQHKLPELLTIASNRQLCCDLVNGLGNRLLTMASTLRISAILDLRPKFNWVEDESAGGSISDYWNEDFVHGEWPTENLNFVSIRSHMGSNFILKNDLKDQSHPVNIIKGWNHVIFFEQELFALLGGCKKVQKRVTREITYFLRYLVEAFKPKTNALEIPRISHYDLGVHIRTHTGLRDNSFNWGNTNINFHVKSILRALDLIGKGNNVFIAMPNSEKKNEILDRLDRTGVNIYFANSWTTETHQEAINLAMCEVMELCKSSHIYRRNISTFSAVSSLIAGNTEFVYDETGNFNQREPLLFSGCAL